MFLGVNLQSHWLEAGWCRMTLMTLPGHCTPHEEVDVPVVTRSTAVQCVRESCGGCTSMQSWQRWLRPSL